MWPHRLIVERMARAHMLETWSTNDHVHRDGRWQLSSETLSIPPAIDAEQSQANSLDEAI